MHIKYLNTLNFLKNIEENETRIRVCYLACKDCKVALCHLSRSASLLTQVSSLQIQ